MFGRFDGCFYGGEDLNRPRADAVAARKNKKGYRLPAEERRAVDGGCHLTRI